MKHTYVDRFGRVVEEHEAIDGRGIIKDGYRLSVALMMKDHAARTPTDDAANTNFGRPREALLRDQAIAATRDEVMRAAYAAYDKENAEAWKRPHDAAPPSSSYPLSAGEGSTCTINGGPGTLVKSGNGLICKPNARSDSQPTADAIKQQAYDAYNHELVNAWRNPRGLR